MLKVFLLFENPPTVSEKEVESHSHGSPGPLPIAGLITCLWAVMAGTVSNAMLEVYTAKLTQQYWGWNVQQTSIYLAFVMACIVPICLSAGRLTQIVEDRKGLIIVCPLGVVFSLLLLLHVEGTVARIGVFTVVLLLILGVSVLVRGFVLSVVTKLVPSHLKPTATLFTIVFFSLGRGAGSLFGAMMNPSTCAPVQMAIYGATTVIIRFSYSQLKPHDKAS